MSDTQNQGGEEALSLIHDCPYIENKKKKSQNAEVGFSKEKARSVLVRARD